MSITGPVDGPPSKVGVAVTDVLTGLQAAVTTLACLHAREKSGHGYAIDLALLDCAVAAQVNVLQAYLTSGQIPGRQGNAHLQIVPYQAFQTADDWLVLAVHTGNGAGQWQHCKAARRPGLASDNRFGKNVQRVAHRAILVPIIEKVMRRLLCAEWQRRLVAAEVPHAPVLDYAQLLAQPQTEAWSVGAYPTPACASYVCSSTLRRIISPCIGSGPTANSFQSDSPRSGRSAALQRDAPPASLLTASASRDVGTWLLFVYRWRYPAANLTMVKYACRLLPYQASQTADDWLVLAVGNDGQWQHFCKAAERPDLASDNRFGKNVQRVAHRAILVPIIEKVMRRLLCAEWQRRLVAAEVPHAPVLDYAQLLAQPQTEARGLRVTVRDPNGQVVDLIGSPYHIAGATLPAATMPPGLGQDTEAVLRELLGYDDARIAKLKQGGVV